MTSELEPSEMSRLGMCGVVLERLIVDLQRCHDAAAQIRLVLDAVRTMLQSDLVLWYPGDDDLAINCAGDPQPPMQWRRHFIHRQLAEAPNTYQFCRALDDADWTGHDFQPHSLVMARFSRSQPVWLAAISANPERIFTREDVKLVSLVRRLLVQERQRVRALENVQSTLLGIVRCLTEAINANNPYTRDHSERVARIAVRLGEEMNLPAEMRSALYLGGLLHDIGKVGIDANVLCQIEPLTQAQRLHIEEHPVIGDRILSTIPSLDHLRPAVRNHHERYDGGGYPDGLQGEQIPLLARVLAVADACDAMFSPRPYRPGMSVETVDRIFAEGAGPQWDPTIIRHFFACRFELYAVYKRGLGDSVEQAIMDVVNLPRSGRSSLS